MNVSIETIKSSQCASNFSLTLIGVFKFYLKSSSVKFNWLYKLEGGL